MAEMKRIEVGFAGGQVMSARVTNDALQTLRDAVQRGHGWHDIEAEDGPVTLNAAHDRLFQQMTEGVLSSASAALGCR